MVCYLGTYLGRLRLLAAAGAFLLTIVLNGTAVVLDGTAVTPAAGTVKPMAAAAGPRPRGRE
jgi:hypothetical protein